MTDPAVGRAALPTVTGLLRLTTGNVEAAAHVKLARAAGIRIVAVATGNYATQQLREAGADWVLDSVEAGFPA